MFHGFKFKDFWLRVSKKVVELIKDNIFYLIASILLGSSRNVRAVTMFRAVVDAGDVVDRERR